MQKKEKGNKFLGAFKGIEEIFLWYLWHGLNPKPLKIQINKKNDTRNTINEMKARKK